MELDVSNPSHWPDIVVQSGIRVKTVCQDFEINSTRFRKWVSGDVTPNKESIKKLVNALSEMQKFDRHPYHNSFGYATPEEFKVLQELKEGGAKQDLINQIEFRYKNKGMVK